MIRPDPDHDALCDSPARHQAVTAPPGTGKTHVSIRLAGRLATTLPAGGQVLVLTFSNQARAQLEREAARQLEPRVRRHVLITNYHRFFWYAVRAHRRALELPVSLDIGSSARRIRALAAVDRDAIKALSAHTGLVDALAEHAFPVFNDDRTPDPATLRRLLGVVDDEQRAGRLVFDDLGALFWALLERYPTLAAAYADRFPRVIADEHQDASGLQDAVVRRLGGERLVVLADPMQLIHGFRGARAERLDAHLRDCEVHHELRTPHRWHGSTTAPAWLLAVRARLEGHSATAARPDGVRLLRTPASYGLNAMLPCVQREAARAFGDGCARVAVLAFRNDQVAKVRAYLCRQGMYPRQLSGPTDFEEAREDIEQLPLLADPQSLARHALTRVRALVPTLPKAIVDQVDGRLGIEQIDARRAGAQAAALLSALGALYEHGAGGYFSAVVDALDACVAQGHHLPRREMVRMLRDTSVAIGTAAPDADRALDSYAARSLAAAHSAPRETRGLFVMTAHQAKGKEFDAVILTAADVRSFPDTADAKRLFYVAITRATRQWSIVAPDRDASPLLGCL